MFVPRLYIDSPLTVGEILPLNKEKSHYLINVIRMDHEQSVIVFNGMGGEFEAQFQIQKKNAFLSIERFLDVSRASTLKIHLGQGIVRGDRMDYIIQKSTELGVNSITPLLLQHAKVKLDKEREIKRVQHWQNIAVSACEQCGRTELPVIHNPITLSEWVNQPFDGLSLVFDLSGQQTLKNLKPQIAMRVAIGPESGWQDNEVKLMQQNSFETLTLGQRVLRVETASVVALSGLQVLFGDLA